MFSKLFLGPVEIPDEGLQSVQLPEEVLRGAGAVTAGPQGTVRYGKRNSTDARGRDLGEGKAAGSHSFHNNLFDFFI